MSSIVNKSGIRFQPKVKQRRAVSNTPVQSRRPSVAPPADPVPSEKPLMQTITKGADDNDNDDENDDDDGEVEEAAHSSDIDPDDPFSKPSTLVPELGPPTPLGTQRRDSTSGSLTTSRRGSILEPTPPATKQRRLSTLSNTTRGGEVLRRGSISASIDSRSHVISIPQPPTSINKRRRSSVNPGLKASSLLKRRSVSEDVESATATPQPVSILRTPPATQLEPPPMSKSEAKSQEDPTIGAPIMEEDEDNDQETGDDVVQKFEDVSNGVGGPAVKMEGLIFDDFNQTLRKVVYDSNDVAMEQRVIKNIRTVSRYSQLSKSLHSVDPEELAKITIDDESFTMEDLCKPTLPIGKISSQFQRAQEARKNRMAARKKRQELRKKAKLERRSIESYADVAPEEKKIKPEDLLDDEHMNEPTQHSAIQLKLGTDGTLIVDEDSRIVDRHRNMDNIIRERHDENPFENIVNSATYGRQRYTDKWDKDEVSKFYQALGTWGTDFALIAQMFPYRTRRQIKSKFILEEKKRPRLIELALSNKLKTQFDFDSYCNDANKTFSTLDEFNVKLEQLKHDHEENLKELSLAKEKAKEEDTQRQKKREFEIQTGQRTMTRQERITELTKHETVLGSIDDVKKQRQQDDRSANL